MNSEGVLARFYESFDFDGGLPDNLCQFFWGLVGRLLLCLAGVFIILVMVLAIGFWGWKYLHFGWQHKWVYALTVGLAIGVVIYRRNRNSGLVAEVGRVVNAKVDAINN